MKGVNKVILIGRIGKDPEARYTTSGDCVVTLSLATSEHWKDKQTGERKEATEWHRCTAFGKPAEIIGEYVKKGSLLYIEGQLKTRKWQDQSGQDRYSTEISIREFQFLDSRPEAAGGAGASRPSANAAGASAQPASTNSDYDDDIPF